MASIIQTMVDWFFAIVAVERITEIITSSEITAPTRAAIGRLAFPVDKLGQPAKPRRLLVWVSKLINCGWCTSVWVSMGILLYANEYLAIPSGLFWLRFFGLVGLANLWHATFELWRRGRVRTQDLVVKHNINIGEQEEEQEDGSTRESAGQETAS